MQRIFLLSWPISPHQTVIFSLPLVSWQGPQAALSHLVTKTLSLTKSVPDSEIRPVIFRQTSSYGEAGQQSVR